MASPATPFSRYVLTGVHSSDVRCSVRQPLYVSFSSRVPLMFCLAVVCPHGSWHCPHSRDRDNPCPHALTNLVADQLITCFIARPAWTIIGLPVKLLAPNEPSTSAADRYADLVAELIRLPAFPLACTRLRVMDAVHLFLSALLGVDATRGFHSRDTSRCSVVGGRFGVTPVPVESLTAGTPRERVSSAGRGRNGWIASQALAPGADNSA